MDINFHYFAIKSIAVSAGFSDDEAQTIAAYSQFVDDYTVWSNYTFDEVPEYAMSLVKERKDSGAYEVTTITTGFASKLDYARLAFPRYQKRVVVPFHFVPVKELSQFPKSASGSEYRTQRADITGSTLAARIIQKARDKYFGDPSRVNLIGLGTALHPFADTYAHQWFSGFHGWENFAYITGIKNTDTGAVVHDEKKPDDYGGLYAVGHAEAGTAPDLSYATFSFKYADNKDQTNKNLYTGQHSRNNTNEFLEAARQIHMILFGLCHPRRTPGDDIWNPLKDKLRKGFMLTSKDKDELAKGWHGIFPDVQYHYSVKELWQDQLVPRRGEQALSNEVEDNGGAPDDNATSFRTASDDFFYFNLAAKEIRYAVVQV